MKAYWDSSALVETNFDPALRARLSTERGVTRTHALAEIFSTMTGGKLPIRYDADDAARVLEGLVADLDFEDLSPQEVLSAFKQARKLGVRGGHVHDLLHAAAADNSGVQHLLTLDRNDFSGLTTKVTVQQV